MMRSRPVDTTARPVADGKHEPSLAVRQLVCPGGIRQERPAAECLARAGLEGLSPDARILLEIGAVVGESFALPDVAGLLGKPSGHLLEAARELLQAGVVVPDGAAITFRDRELCRALASRLPRPLSIVLHAEVGCMLYERGGAPVSAAVHLLEATSHGDRAALARLDEVVLELLPEHPEAAADVALRTLELTDRSDAHWGTRHVAACDALTAAQRHAEAGDLARSALKIGNLPRTVLAELRVRLAASMLAAGLPAEAAQELERLLADDGLEGTLAARGQALLLEAFLAGGRFEAAGKRTFAVLTGGAAARSDAALGGALGTLSVLRWREGRAEAGVDMMRAAAARAAAHGVPSSPFASLKLAAMLISLGELDEAEDRLGQSELAVEQMAPGPLVGVPRALRARLHWAAGRLDEARVEAMAVLTAARERGSSMIEPLARSVLASVALAQSDVRAAAEQVAAGCRDGACPGLLLSTCACDYLEARVAEAEGRPREPIPPCRSLFLQDPSAAPFLVRLAMDSDDRPAAEHAVRCASALAEANSGCRSVVAAFLHARGLLERRPDLLVKAADLHRWPMARARAVEDAGAVMSTGDEPGSGRNWLEQAVSAYQEIGALHDAARARARLRTLGVRCRHWCRRERPVLGWDSLTETECTVAGLVAEGLTNRQVGERMFLSSHTIDFHLRHIFRKLQISSRVDLTRMTIEQQLAQDERLA